MGNELIIGDYTTLKRMLEPEMTDWCRDSDTALTITNQMADKAREYGLSATGVNIRQMSDYASLADYRDRHGISWITMTDAEASALYYSSESGLPILTDRKCISGIARRIGLTVYNTNEIVINYKKQMPMTG
ncbi:MAG: hypothetical protein J6Y82_03900 [Bacteroidales bacterium]|nr:hypothetical protein [Bacteroidales bacterium]